MKTIDGHIHAISIVKQKYSNNELYCMFIDRPEKEVGESFVLYLTGKELRYLKERIDFALQERGE